MAIPTSLRGVNPRLGTYYGIFLGAFTSLSLVALILEGLGVGPHRLSLALLAGLFLLLAIIGLGTRSSEPLDFFAAGRRVPAFFNGLVLAMSAFGATGFVILTGLFFVIGFDALFIAIGALAGFVVMAVMLAPFLRKFGAYTIPSYLGRRFDSRILRVTSAVLLAVPMLMVLAAELKLALLAAQGMVGWGAGQLALLMTLVLLTTLVPGGMRSMTWTGVAQGLVALLAIIVPVSVVAVYLTNMPFAQLTHGPVLRALGRSEAVQGLPLILPPALALDLPGQELQPIAKRFADAFGAAGAPAFVLAMLSVLAGVAAAPWLLPRLASAPGVYEARKTLGWATFLFGVAMLTVASVAVFLRSYVFQLLAVPNSALVPPWLGELVKRGWASVTETGTQLQATGISFARDGVLFSLPIVGELPHVLLDLTMVGSIAAALVAASASATALGLCIGEDIAQGGKKEALEGPARLHLARAGIVMAIVGGAALALAANTDPLRLVLWALSLSGAALLPVLVLSIWWKRINPFGALAGLMTGFGVTAVAIISSETGYFGIDSALAAVLGLPAAAVATIAVTLATPAPSRHLLELVRDIRVPGGEILYDREMRLLRLKRQRQQS